MGLELIGWEGRDRRTEEGENWKRLREARTGRGTRTLPCGTLARPGEAPPTVCVAVGLNFSPPGCARVCSTHVRVRETTIPGVQYVSASLSPGECLTARRLRLAEGPRQDVIPPAEILIFGNK